LKGLGLDICLGEGVAAVEEAYIIN
jgi:hypothetical protein